MILELAVFIAVSNCNPGSSTLDSYTICAEKSESATSTSSSGSGSAPKAVPMRLCSYYVNNTIDEPTQSIINSWVPVGSRLCIGDDPPAEVTRTKTVSSSSVTKDTLTGYSNRPLASWLPGGELVVLDPARFFVDVNNRTTTGTLLGSSAQIRFTASSVLWEFSDGQGASGVNAMRSFEEAGSYQAVAVVSYRVDYRIAGSSWVLGASTLALESNRLSIEVVEPPRRTLLVQ